MKNYKCIFIKDPHLAFGFQNKIRKNYRVDIEGKLEFISNYCVENGIKDIIFTGDVFDTQREGQWSFKQFLANKLILEKYFTDKGLGLFSPAGNHDFFNGRETIENTVFGEMVNDGIINYIGAGNIYEPVEDLRIIGVDWSADKSKIIQQLETIEDNNFNIVVIHMNCTKESSIFTDFTWDFLVDNYPQVNAWVLGHYHVGTGVTNYKNKIFIDPWNMTRVARDYHVKMDKFNVSMVDFRIEDGKLKVAEVTIPHKPFREAFVDEFVNLMQKTKSEQQDFFSKINIEELLEETDDSSLLDKIIKQQNYNNKVKSKVLEYLNG